MDGVSTLLSSPITWIVVTASAAYYFYRYVASSFNYFSNQGIPGPKPVPFVGNMWGIWNLNMPKEDRKLMEKYGKLMGYFEGQKPNLWFTDTDMIKSVFVKDFDHFINRRNLSSRVKVLRKFIIMIRDQEWKDVRSSITPAFTTGKIKRMSLMIKECADKLVVKFETIAKCEGKIDSKFQFSIFSMDVIARCIFNMTIDNLGVKDDPFVRNAKKLLTPPVTRSPLILLFFVYPKLVAWIGEMALQFVGPVAELRYFSDIIERMIKEREESPQKYHDFVEAMMETIADYTKDADGKTVPVWTKEEVNEIIIAQSIVFMLAGYETTSTTLSSTIFQLAKNPDIQERFHDEIANKVDEFGEVNHEMIMDFPYVDQIIHEVMRMYPSQSRIERECNKDITINGVRFKEGMLITVPTFALHYDPDYYKNPNTFDPDRWAPENKPNLDPYAYMPFGMGPRNCVGMRFALEEMKIVLCTIIQHFRFFCVEETPEEIQYESGLLQIAQPLEATVGIELRQ